jgi:hypothetical protein
MRAFLPDCFAATLANAQWRVKDSFEPKQSLWVWILNLFLLPIDVVAEFRLETLDVKAKHPVNAELSELARITIPKRSFFLDRELVIRHDTFEIRQGMLVYGFLHFQIE